MSEVSGAILMGARGAYLARTLASGSAAAQLSLRNIRWSGDVLRDIVSSGRMQPSSPGLSSDDGHFSWKSGSGCTGLSPFETIDFTGRRDVSVVGADEPECRLAVHGVIWARVGIACCSDYQSRTTAAVRPADRPARDRYL